ncbi:MAG: hypothetical protein MZV65_17625 [Chromatiales bacterium]|nr:hypothetical protein [Chromatiales bacterium]
MIDWLAKPVDAGRLLAAVETATRAVGSGRVRVLHVEDDPDIRRVVASLGGAVAEFDHAASVNEAGAQAGARALRRGDSRSRASRTARAGNCCR